MNASTEHRLVGLEPDNLLTFLALLGLLRALECKAPGWHPRVRWDAGNPPTRPVLCLAQRVSAAELAEAAAEGCAILAQDFEFEGWKVPNRPRAEARALLENSLESPGRRARADLMAALISDIAVKENEDSVMPTPLCLLFGQGHQYFLDRLAAVPRQASAPPQGKGKKAITLSPGETIERALFEPWRRIDASPSFRWDPEEDRRYALRFSDPSKDTALTVHGANRLAAIGLPVLTVVPVTVRGRIRLQAVGLRSNARVIEMTWPIWTKLLSLSGIRALLTHPLLHKDLPDQARLAAFGVHELRRASRISVGKFLNFTRGSAL